MAQNISYIAIAAAFTPSGGSSTPITDLEHVDYGESGQEVDMTTDASITVNGMFLDSIKGEITVQTSDLTLLEASNAFVMGTTGSLLITYGKRQKGVGIISGSNRTLTCANAQVRSITPGAGATGASVINIRFGAYDPAGASVRTWA